MQKTKKAAVQHIFSGVSLAVLLGFAPHLAGCAAPGVAMGLAATGAYVGLQERSSAQVALDAKMKVHILDRLSSAKLSYVSDVGVTVFEGDVLLTGIVPNKQQGLQVLELVRAVPDVKRVYNELFVGADYPTKQQAQDTWIYAQIQPRLMGNRQTFPINYAISVVNGHAYIMGYVVATEEHEHVLHILRTTKGVVQVHDYLRLSASGKDPRTPDASGINGIGMQPAPALPETN
ncbi:MAG: BON domain-containing protein [Alphaproteobacteria bacterium]